MASGHVSNVTSLLCCGPNYQYDNLWAGDSVGYLTLWQVPRRGLDFKPLKSFQAHNLAIREDIDNDGSGVVVIGTSQGEIIVLPLGNRV
eukprot:gene18347-24040_t